MSSLGVETFIIMTCPFLFLVILYLKVYLSDFNLTTPAFLCLLSARYDFMHLIPFNLSLYI